MDSPKTTSTQDGPTTPRLSSRTALDGLCTNIIEKHHEGLRRRATVRPQRIPRASAIDKCARKMALEILHWDKRPAFDEYSQARVERGTHIEELIVMPALMQMGFKVWEGQASCEIRSRDGKRTICTGHVDAIIEQHGHRFVMDCKSMHPMLWSRVESVEDLLEQRYGYRYPWQLLLYMWAHDVEGGLFLIDDCLGHWRAIPVHLWDHAVRCEEALTRCEEVVNALDTGADLPYHPDASYCRECWAFKQGVCTPPMDFSKDEIGILENEELVECLERMEELEESGKEFVQLDKRMKEIVKAVEGTDFLAGNFLIKRKEITTTRYDVPKDVKEPYKKESTIVRVSWNRIAEEEK